MNTLLQSKTSQSGAVLITALFLLVILTMLALSSMSTNIMDEKMASNTQEKSRAFRAAEVGIELAFNDDEAFLTTNTLASDNTANDPYQKDEKDIGDYDANVAYNAVFLQKTKPPRGSGYDSNTFFYFFKLSAVSETKGGASTTLVQGAYTIGQ